LVLISPDSLFKLNFWSILLVFCGLLSTIIHILIPLTIYIIPELTVLHTMAISLILLTGSATGVMAA
jgi:hypothetical protein